MKICHVMSARCWGGREQFIHDLVRESKSRGHDVELLVHVSSAVREMISDLGVPVKSFSLWNLFRTKADIIHLHKFKSVAIVALVRALAHRRTKLIVSQHSVGSAKKGWWHRFLYSQIDRLVFVSHLAKEDFFASRPDVDAKKCAVVWNGIARGTESEEFEDVRRLFPNGTTILMFHGRLEREKGLLVLIRALERLKDESVGLVVIGTGERKFVESLKGEVARMGLRNVRFLGFKRNVMSYVRQADIGIVPSLIRESFCLSCVEYMRAGKVVITTNNGAQPEYIDGANGVLVDPGDANQLADAVRRLLRSESRSSFGRKARETYERNFRYSVFFEKLSAIYEDCLVSSE